MLKQQERLEDLEYMVDYAIKHGAKTFEFEDTFINTNTAKHFLEHLLVQTLKGDL